MNSYRQILYHIVFCTYNRENTIPPVQQEGLYKYIGGIITNRKGVLYQINGMENHIHILSDLHPTVALADFIKEIKTASNFWMKQTGKYPEFTYWAEGYCAGCEGASRQQRPTFNDSVFDPGALSCDDARGVEDRDFAARGKPFGTRPYPGYL